MSKLELFVLFKRNASIMFSVLTLLLKMSTFSM